MSENKQGCVQKTRSITLHDLPLSCPTQEERVWDAHPRVYLDVEATGSVVCPYCETLYILE